MKKFFFFIISALLASWATYSIAGVTVGGTRVIYDGSKREATLSVRNPDKRAFLIQAWADNDGQDGSNTNNSKPPFIVTPPLFRLNSGSENIMRIIRTDNNLPGDRESIFWMNVKSIPSMSEDAKNVLQIAVKTRIKLIYRPKGVEPLTDEALNSLVFSRDGDVLKVSNPTPNYVSFSYLKVDSLPVQETFTMVAPKGESKFHLSSSVKGKTVSWRAINDYGGESQEQSSLLK